MMVGSVEKRRGAMSVVIEVVGVVDNVREKAVVVGLRALITNISSIVPFRRRCFRSFSDHSRPLHVKGNTILVNRLHHSPPTPPPLRHAPVPHPSVRRPLLAPFFPCLRIRWIFLIKPLDLRVRSVEPLFPRQRKGLLITWGR